LAIAANGPVREVTSQAMRVPLQSIPGFQKGCLFFLDHANVQVYTPAGFQAFAAVVNIPKVTELRAIGLAADTDGSVAVSVGYKTASGFGGGIVYFDSGSQTTFLDTGLYMPANLSFGEDHSLWVFGWQRDDGLKDHADRQDYMMVRKYSPDRKEAGRYLARSLFPRGLEPGTHSWQELRIAAVHDRVGLLAWSGDSSKRGEWVELDLNGQLIRRVPVDDPHGAGKLAFTSDGHLYRVDPSGQPKTSGRLLVLDRTAPEWTDVGSSPAPFLWGADGNQLVFSTFENGPIRLQWFAPPGP
jgi:hypothetical protein